MKFEHTEVWGFEHALRGMRNPKESWGKSDSLYENGEATLGPNDLDLAKRLVKAGPTHRKFLRQIFVSVDITAPLYWWSEFDTYKVGTVANSTSKMHKLATTPITRDRFELDFEYENEREDFREILRVLENLRKEYLETKDIHYWRLLVQLLPESWLQTRTVTLDYETLHSMCQPDTRRNHKLKEWSRDFMFWVAQELPYSKELIFGEE